MTQRAHETQSQVLAVLRCHRSPLSAYDAIGELRPISPKIAPPTVCRALEVLAGRGLVHCIESLKASVACQYDECQHASAFVICDDCGTAEESFAPDLLEELFRVAEQSRFTLTRHVIEIHGLCPSRGKAAPQHESASQTEPEAHHAWGCPSLSQCIACCRSALGWVLSGSLHAGADALAPGSRYVNSDRPTLAFMS